MKAWRSFQNSLGISLPYFQNREKKELTIFIQLVNLLFELKTTSSLSHPSVHSTAGCWVSHTAHRFPLGKANSRIPL